MKKLMITSLFLVALFAMTGCSEDNNPMAVDTTEKVKPSERTTIVDLALAVNAETGEFSTLIAALVAADLVDALNGNGQLTVFAPTDEAFAAIDLDETNIGDLPKEALTDILLYHVAKGRRMAEDVVESSQIRMLNGDRTMIKLMDGNAYIDDAMIVGVDNETDNGVVHIINGVLLP